MFLFFKDWKGQWIFVSADKVTALLETVEKNHPSELLKAETKYGLTESEIDSLRKALEDKSKIYFWVIIVDAWSRIDRDQFGLYPQPVRFLSPPFESETTAIAWLNAHLIK